MRQAIGYVMNDFGDLGAKLEKLREDATDCELIGRLATDKNKRDLFRKLAVDLRSLAQDIADLITVKQQALERDNNRTQIRTCSVGGRRLLAIGGCQQSSGSRSGMQSGRGSITGAEATKGPRQT